MKRLGKTLSSAFAVLVLVVVSGITFTIGWRPFIGPRTRPLTARKFQSTPERLTRGKYLVMSVTDCMGCHAEHDWTAHDAPMLPTHRCGPGHEFAQGFPPGRCITAESPATQPAQSTAAYSAIRFAIRSWAWMETLEAAALCGACRSGI